MERTHALTIDVEDYFHVSAFEREIDRRDWPSFECRVEQNTRRLLDLFALHRVHGTFFVLGWVAERYPQLIADIHTAGHEIASHGFWHRLVYTQSPAEFREDIRMSKQCLEDIAGTPVTAYRAPSFSITKSSRWSLEILAEEGFSIDSSIFPIYHDRYGMPGARREPHPLATPSGTLWEFPPSVCRFAGKNIPIAGGGYFRLFPSTLMRRFWNIAQRQTSAPLMFYLHPWEIDPKQPRLRKGSLATRFRHYLNLGSTYTKLSKMLSHFRFAPIRDVAAQFSHSSVPTAREEPSAEPATKPACPSCV